MPDSEPNQLEINMPAIATLVQTPKATPEALAASIFAKAELVHAQTERTEEQQDLYEGWLCRRQWSHWTTTVPDVAMVPKVWKGQGVTFDPTLEPHEGDGVLILLPNGDAYLRELQFEVDDRGDFTGVLAAVATCSEDYRSFYSNTDHFIVLGVLVAVHGRWS